MLKMLASLAAVVLVAGSLGAGMAGAADDSKVKEGSKQVESGAKQVGEGVVDAAKGVGKTRWSAGPRSPGRRSRRPARPPSRPPRARGAAAATGRCPSATV